MQCSISRYSPPSMALRPLSTSTTSNAAGPSRSSARRRAAFRIPVRHPPRRGACR
jgi:hypothetical protein